MILGITHLIVGDGDITILGIIRLTIAGDGMILGTIHLIVGDGVATGDLATGMVAIGDITTTIIMAVITTDHQLIVTLPEHWVADLQEAQDITGLVELETIQDRLAVDHLA